MTRTIEGFRDLEPTRDEVDRFWSKVRIEDRGYKSRCWIWTAYCNGAGYGCFSYRNRQRFAHRVAWHFFRQPAVPEVLDHLCEVKACCNPLHVEPSTIWENSKRGSAPPALNVKKTHCPEGHEYTPENTIRRKDHPTWRQCRTCKQTPTVPHVCPNCGAEFLARQDAKPRMHCSVECGRESQRRLMLGNTRAKRKVITDHGKLQVFVSNEGRSIRVADETGRELK